VRDSVDDKRIAARRQNWSTKCWRASEHGNAFINVRGFNITVFGSRKGYGIRISQRYGERCQFGKRRYETRVEAQAAAFDALVWAEQTWHGNGRYDLPASAMQPAPG
jgi:hypothetical protein